MNRIKETWKRLKWNVARFAAYLAFRVSIDPFTLFTDLPDGYTPYEKGYEAYESEKKSYEEKCREYYARRKRGKRRSVSPAIKERHLIRRKVRCHQRNNGSHNSTNKPKYVNCYFIQRRLRKNSRNSASIK